jgi:hypothetical protein
MQRPSSASSKIFNATSYELKLLLRGILIPAILISFFTYIIISIIDVERTGIYNSIPSSIILCIGTIVVLKLLFYTKLEQIEIRRYTLIFLTIICWTIGELIYVYYQTFAGIAVPYPSIADIFYLSATIFLSFHLYGVLHVKKNILKTKYLVYLGFIASIFPIYLLFDTVYNYQVYYPDSILEFLVNIAYYITDAVVIFPCIPIILSMRRNDPFIFQWLLITVSVFILVVADLGYTFVASINDELLQDIEWLFSFIFSIGYILLTMSIIWFSKIKGILEYRKFSEFLKNEQNANLSGNEMVNDSVEKLEDPNQILGTMASITEKAQEHIDVLFSRYFIQKQVILNFIDIMGEKARKNRLLDIRILLPSPRFSDADVPSNLNSNISIKYFDRHLSSNTVSSIVDNEFLYIVGSEAENTSDRIGYFVLSVNSESKKLVYTALFERMWLLEKSVDFG